MWYLQRSTKVLAKEIEVADLPAFVEDMRRLLRGIPACMLTTRSEELMHARPMMLRTIDADGRLLFLASQRSLIVAHLAAHPQVSITFVQPHDGLYVAIFGIGAIASDPAQVRPWWNWSYRAWYPRGWRDPDLVLLTVAVKQLEYWFAPSIRATRAARSIQASLLHRSGEDATHGILIVNGQHEPLP